MSSRAVAVLATAFLVLGMYAVAPAPAAAQEYSPSFNVLPDEDVITGGDFTPFAAMTFTFDGAPLSAGAVTTDANGSFWVHAPADLVVGDLVAASDGTFTKEVTVTGLAQTGISGDVLQGSAETATVHTWIEGMDGLQRTVPVTGGVWHADYGVVGDEPHEQATATLTPGMTGWMQARDDDGDTTMVRWRYANPHFTVSPDGGWIRGWEFPANAAVAITLAGSPAAADPGTTDANGNFSYGTDEPISVGDAITVTVGSVTRDTLVSGVAVTSVTGSAVSGVADTPEIQLWVDGMDVLRHLAVTGGAWGTDVSQPGGADGDHGTVDLAPGMSVTVWAADADGDATQTGWRIRRPVFNVQPANDSLSAQAFEPGATLDTTVTRSDTIVASASVQLDAWGNAGMGLDVDVIPGDLVTVTDGQTTKSTVVTQLTVTGADDSMNSLSGTGVPGTTLNAWIHGTSVHRNDVAVDGQGGWTVDFSVIGDQPDEQETWDLVPGDNGGVNQTDPDGDATMLFWHVAAPAFNVHFQDRSLWAWDFTPWGALTATVTRGSETIAETTNGLDAYGNCGIDFEVDLLPGDVVTISDEATTKSTIVTSIQVSGVDADTETVVGTAEPGSTVGLWVDGTNVGRENEPVDQNGAWAINVAAAGDEPGEEATTDLVPGMSGAALQRDEDGDSTVDSWGVRAPAFNVHPLDDMIYGWDFEPGAQMAITRNGEPLQGWLDWDEWGNFSFESVDDILAGDVISVSDGTYTKATSVTNLSIDGVDPEYDAVWGSAEPGSTVGAWVWMTEFPGRNNELVDEQGGWYISFSVFGDEDWEQNTFDIGPGSHGAAGQRDDDGDSTMVDWRIAAPAFNAHPVDNVVDGWDFAANTQLYVLLDGSGVDDGGFWTDDWGNFWFDLDDVAVDILPGNVIEIGDGITAKTTTVTELVLAGVDQDADVVSGSGLPGTLVNVWVNDTGDEREETIAGDGSWTANFAVPGDQDWEQGTADIDLGWSGGARQQDADGDSTVIDWRVPAPAFNVHPDYPAIDGWDFAANAYVTITRVRGGEPLDEGQVGTDEWGNFWYDVPDIQPGDDVTVTDGTTVKTTTVTALQLGGVDVETETVSGTAEPGTMIGLWLNDQELGRENEPVDGNGNWAVSVGQVGDEDWEWQTADLGPGSSGGVQQRDEDGDSTVVDWRVPAPAINVYPEWEAVEGWDFLPGSPISVTHAGTRVDDGTLTADEGGSFWFDFNELGIDVVAGDSIEVSDGSSTKQTTVTQLMLTGIDSEADAVFGTAEPLSTVGTWVHDTDANRENEPVDGNGYWRIELGAPGDEPWEWETCDIGPGSGGGAFQRDEDGDQTVVEWRVANPNLQVNLTDNGITGWEFGGDVTVTLLDPATGVGDTWAGDAIWYEEDRFELWLDPSSPDGWDFGPGQVVTVSGPEVTKVLEIADVTIDGWDFAENTISGSTDHPYQLDVSVSAPMSGSWISVMPDEGSWIADFDFGDPPHAIRVLDRAWVEQYDADGDRTAVYTWLAGERFTVDLLTQAVYGFGWPEGATVELRINGVFVASAIAATEGRDSIIPLDGTPNVYFELNPPDQLIRPGDTVALSDSMTTKTQLIPDLAINLADTEADTLSGTTTSPEPGGFLVVEPDWWTGCPHEVTPVSDGTWATSWLGEWDIWSNTGFAIQTDADGDQTGTATPDPRVIVDPQANRIWALDFAIGEPLSLTIVDDGGVVIYADAGWSENRLYRGMWLRDMWTQPVGDLERPTVGLWDLGGLFDIQATFVVSVSDGASTVSTTVAVLSVDSIDAATDTVSGQATGDVALNLNEGAGFWGYRATPVDGQWSFHFDPSVFPNQGLDPGMLGVAIADTWTTVVRWVVPEEFSYDFGGFIKPIKPPPAVNAAKAGQVVKISFSLGGDYGLDILEDGAPTWVTVSCPAGSPIGAEEAAIGTLTYNARKDVYSYLWVTSKAWKGTCRELTFSFDDGSQQVIDFGF